MSDLQTEEKKPIVAWPSRTEMVKRLRYVNVDSLIVDHTYQRPLIEKVVRRIVSKS